MFINFGPSEATASLKVIKQLRAAGISCELYPDAAKLKKQMNYANTAGIPFVALIGESEAAAGTLTLRNMTAGTQATLTPAQAIKEIKG